MRQNATNKQNLLSDKSQMINDTVKKFLKFTR